MYYLVQSCPHACITMTMFHCLCYCIHVQTYTYPVVLCIVYTQANGTCYYRIYSIAQGKQIRYYKASESDEGAILKVPSHPLHTTYTYINITRSHWTLLGCLWLQVVQTNQFASMIFTLENALPNCMDIQVLSQISVCVCHNC